MSKIICYISKKYNIVAYTEDKSLMKRFIKQIDGDYICTKVEYDNDQYTDGYQFTENKRLYESYGAILNSDLEEFIEEKAVEIEGELIGAMYAINDLLEYYRFDSKKDKKALNYFNELFEGYIEMSANGIRSLSLLENVEYRFLLKKFLHELRRT